MGYSFLQGHHCGKCYAQTDKAGVPVLTSKLEIFRNYQKCADAYGITNGTVASAVRIPHRINDDVVVKISLEEYESIQNGSKIPPEKIKLLEDIDRNLQLAKYGVICSDSRIFKSQMEASLEICGNPTQMSSILSSRSKTYKNLGFHRISKEEIDEIYLDADKIYSKVKKLWPNGVETGRPAKKKRILLENVDLYSSLSDLADKIQKALSTVSIMLKNDELIINDTKYEFRVISFEDYEKFVNNEINHSQMLAKYFP